MNKQKVSRIVIIVLISVLNLNCSSADDGDSDLTISNKTKIVGLWYETDQCAEQNRFMYDADLGYQRLDSGNLDCNNNETSTCKFTGVYNIVNNELFFNQQTDEIVIQGSTLTIQEFEQNSSINYTIEILNETNLLIKTTRTSDSGVTTFSNSFER